MTVITKMITTAGSGLGGPSWRVVSRSNAIAAYNAPSKVTTSRNDVTPEIFLILVNAQSCALLEEPPPVHAKRLVAIMRPGESMTFGIIAVGARRAHWVRL